MNWKKFLEKAGMIFAGAGIVNWLFVGLFSFDLVQKAVGVGVWDTVIKAGLVGGLGGYWFFTKGIKK